MAKKPEPPVVPSQPVVLVDPAAQAKIIDLNAFRYRRARLNEAQRETEGDK